MPDGTLSSAFSRVCISGLRRELPGKIPELPGYFGFLQHDG